MRRIRSGCCARAASGARAAAPPRSVMNSRRLMGSIPGWAIRSIMLAAFYGSVSGSTSGIGTKRTCRWRSGMSAFGVTADMSGCITWVR